MSSFLQASFGLIFIFSGHLHPLGSSSFNLSNRPDGYILGSVNPVNHPPTHKYNKAPYFFLECPIFFMRKAPYFVQNSLYTIVASMGGLLFWKSSLFLGGIFIFGSCHYCHNPNYNTTHPQHHRWVGHKYDCASPNTTHPPITTET